MIVESPLRPASRSAVLGRYIDPAGRSREIVVRRGFAGSSLVIDRDAATLDDRRLVAHLAADEPARNATLVCNAYVRDARANTARCRRVVADDFRRNPFPDDLETCFDSSGWRGRPLAEPGSSSALRLLKLHTGMAIPELRWCRCANETRAPLQPVSVREAIASLQSYEPVRSLTRRALAQASAGGVSAAVLRAELSRVLESPIVLNHRLREVALAMIDRSGLSLSQIAIRCGRIKRDAAGNVTGETSWLARRLGILPEGGKQAPTPWIHSDVLALIARRGLGVSPREVEAG
jgi:hypothetical protein